MVNDDTYDLVLVGTGFASAFFLHRYLARAKERVRVLVLERGVLHEHAYHMKQREALTASSLREIHNRTPEKNGRGAGLARQQEHDQLQLITTQGKKIRVRCAGIRSTGRAAQGVRLMHLEEGDSVSAAVKIP